MEDGTANVSQKKDSVAIPMSDKIDFKPKKNNKRQGRTLYNGKGDNPSRSHNIY